MSTYNNNPDEIGAIWPKEVNGKKFYTGKVTINGQETKIVIRENNFKKEGDKQPTHRIYIDTWKPTGQAPKATVPAVSSAKPVVGRRAPVPRSSAPVSVPDSQNEAQPVAAADTTL